MFNIKFFFVLYLIPAILALEENEVACKCPNKGSKAEIRIPGTPVCGSDGRTYDSQSELKCFNKCKKKDIKLVAPGRCPCNCPMPLIRLPVCASDGQTYVNSYAIECHNKCNYHQLKITLKQPCKVSDKELTI